MLFRSYGLIMVLTFTLGEMCEMALGVVRKSHSELVGNGHFNMSEIFTPMQRSNDESIGEESQPIDSPDD